MNRNEFNSVHWAELKRFRKQVLERDSYACIMCCSRENLEVDHIEPFALRPDKAFIVENGRTLCKECHRKFQNSWRPKPVALTEEERQIAGIKRLAERTPEQIEHDLHDVRDWVTNPCHCGATNRYVGIGRWGGMMFPGHCCGCAQYCNDLLFPPETPYYAERSELHQRNMFGFYYPEVSLRELWFKVTGKIHEGDHLVDMNKIVDSFLVLPEYAAIAEIAQYAREKKWNEKMIVFNDYWLVVNGEVRRGLE